MNQLRRYLHPQLKAALNTGKIVILYGPRQVGKTTLTKKIGSEFTNSLYLNCDEPDVIELLSQRTSLQLQQLVGDAELLIIDEAQRVPDIGLTLKLFHDSMPQLKVIATGSSSLDLANQVKEPLTGRSREFELFPLALTEVSTNRLELTRNLEHALIYGGYPGHRSESQIQQQHTLRDLATNYLYRDAFNAKTIFDTSILNQLLQLLAYQIGAEVSYHKLGQHLGIRKETVLRYISLLEHARIIFRLNQYRANQRNQVGRLRKVFFYDLGIRNGLINNFAPLTQRQDTGALFENLMIMERRKYLQQQARDVSQFYWRHKAGQEVDLIEIEQQAITGFEFKYSDRQKAKHPSQFKAQHPEIPWSAVTASSFPEFIT